MPNYHQLFYEALGRVRSDKRVEVSIYSTKPDIKNGQAYVTQPRPHFYSISLFSANNTYRELLLYLCHEYGHVLDEEKYYRSKRLRLYLEHEYEDPVDAPKVPKYAMRAILKTEYLAEQWIPTLLKRWGMWYDEFTPMLKVGCALQMLSRKYEYNYGKFLSMSFLGTLKKGLAENVSGIVTGKAMWYDTDFNF